MDDESTFNPTCPVPRSSSSRVLLAHGGGGRSTQRLIEEVFLPAFGNPFLLARHDGAVLDLPPSASGSPRLAMTTDSYVVQPLFFPGGDIGSLAVFGTVNDLAMCGARPLWLSVGFILEEGFPMDDLRRVVASMRAAADAASVQLVTGDTKVVDKGKGDGLFVNTAGIGLVEATEPIGPGSVRPGDRILLSGDLGRHGMAILAAREGLGFESSIESDCAPLAGPVLDLIRSGLPVHCLRDLTRGGLGAALVEIAEASGHRLAIQEADVPVREDVAAACEVLGLDPLYVANEGRFAVLLAEADAEEALRILRRHEVSRGACSIGAVGAEADRLVTMTTRLGSSRVVDLPSGEQLPRIC
ncbi:MAG TPA: hydrogenase expression/formation protein HypE [Vicinamibacteria bacterium]